MTFSRMGSRFECHLARVAERKNVRALQVGGGPPWLSKQGPLPPLERLHPSQSSHFLRRYADPRLIKTVGRTYGPKFVMIYFGSAGCAGSNRPELPNALEMLKLRLAGYAEQYSMGFKAICVAFDWDPQNGIGHLRKLGRFDEIPTGSHWGNTLAVRYKWPEPSVPPMTPQVLVYRRVFTIPSDSTIRPSFGESELELLGAVSGSNRIVDWARSEAVLPVHVGAAN